MVKVGRTSTVMPGITGSIIKRRRPKINYAALNKKGFTSIKTTRTRKCRQKATNAKRSLSPVFLNITDNIVVEEGGKQLRKRANPEHVLRERQGKHGIHAKHDNRETVRFTASTNNESVNNVSATKNSEQSSSGVNTTKSSVNASDNFINSTSTPKQQSIIPSCFADMDMSVLDGLSLEQKKEKLRQMNAEMEAQLEREEADQELQELLAKQEALAKRLNSFKEETPKSKKTSKSNRKNRINKKAVQKKRENSMWLGDMHDYISSVGGETERGFEPVNDLDTDVFSKLPTLSSIQDLLHVADKRTRNKKTKKSKKRSRKHRCETSSESSETSDSTSSEETSDSDTDEEYKKKKKGRKLKSGLYAKPGSVKLVSDEIFAHNVLDEELHFHRNIESLSFNLLVAGELEIISDPNIGHKEHFSRTEVLKKLAYKAEHLPREEVIKQYVNFVRKVEKGKYKWGSWGDLRNFEQQLVYAISIEGKREKSQKLKKQVGHKKNLLFGF